MKDNFVVTLYCGNGEIDKAFEYLNILYLSNYKSGALYGVVADLQPSVCYSAASDRVLLESAKRNIDTFTMRYGAFFFCAVRGRSYDPGNRKRPYPYYFCKGGAEGALKDTIKYFSFISDNNGIKSSEDISCNGSFLSVIGNTAVSTQPGQDDHGVLCFSSFGVPEKPWEDGGYFPWEKSKYSGNFHEILLPSAGGIDIMHKLFIANRNEKVHAVRPAVTVNINKHYKYSNPDGMYPLNINEFENRGDDVICREVNYERITQKAYNILFRYNNSGKSEKLISRTAIKHAAGCAADEFISILKQKHNRLYSAVDIAYALCGTVAMNFFGFLSLQETLKLSDELISRLWFITGTEETEGAEGETVLCLTSLSGLYSRLGEVFPEFYLLKSELCGLLSFLLPRTVLSWLAGNRISGLVGMLCYKEINVSAEPGDKLPVMVKKLIFGDSESSFWADVQGKIGRGEIYACCCILVRAAQLCFDSVFSDSLFESEIFRAKSGILGKLYMLEEVVSNGKTSLTERLVRKVEQSAGLLPVKKRFESSGCDTELLQYVAYLDRCSHLCDMGGSGSNESDESNGSNEGNEGNGGNGESGGYIVDEKIEMNPDGEKLICFCADEAYALLLYILKAASAVRSVKLAVITKDSCSHKKLKEVNSSVAAVTVMEKNECRRLKESAVYFRQLTPYTTLSELLRSV